MLTSSGNARRSFINLSLQPRNDTHQYEEAKGRVWPSLHAHVRLPWRGVDVHHYQGACARGVQDHGRHERRHVLHRPAARRALRAPERRTQAHRAAHRARGHLHCHAAGGLLSESSAGARTKGAPASKLQLKRQIELALCTILRFRKFSQKQNIK